MVEIGKIIESVLRERRIPITEFARSINTTRNNVYHIFQRATIDTGLLCQICEILDHDFFQYYIVDKSSTDKFHPISNDSEMQALRKQNEILFSEVDLLKAMLRDKEMIIDLLQSKARE